VSCGDLRWAHQREAVVVELGLDLWMVVVAGRPSGGVCSSKKGGL